MPYSYVYKLLHFIILKCMYLYNFTFLPIWVLENYSKWVKPQAAQHGIFVSRLFEILLQVCAVKKHLGISCTNCDIKKYFFYIFYRPEGAPSFAV